MYWNERYECMPEAELQELQLERLQATVRRAFFDVPFYRRAFQEIGLEPGDIKSLDDLQRLPFTTKQDLRDNYPYGMFAVPMSEIVRIHSSSGTTGKPTVVGYTRHDIDVWSELMARALVCGGATRHDIIQNAYGYGLFTGGLGIHYGSERLGASVIPISGGNTKRQVMIMKDYGSTVLTCTPSYALHIAEVMAEMGIKPEEIKLRCGIFGAEPWSESMRQEIEKRLGISAVDIYGLSEVIGPGVGIECQEKNGLHIFADHFLIEIIDPVTGKQLPPGQRGELVITSLTKEALPVIRYRTRDITSLIPGPCPCGRTHPRVARFTGRTDDMLIIRGVNVFPSQVESVLLEMGGTEPHYLLIVDRQGSLDTLEIKVEVSETLFSDKVRRLEDLEKRLRHELESTLGISVKVTLVEPKSIQRSEGKAVRVIDKRKI
ncbi:phenylacetate-coenzyme A ligase [Moorella thermoacetica]|uniref:Phenylacetate-coenzyme A ligase n=2 Tax=Neomoorella thermoacetica TaxID=1525 RepID=A0A1D7X7U7_NEOTH|nr:phenylacetate--CoA ligase [Moorella thermoacetica]AKX93266.1 phenylacetate-coenzyme A ligase [Moorella thermoacetica]AKX95909.1 phenylacetate-coenzyme A ligase [Moorella thermoacetica]AOQ22984.1 Phenylacetate-coenzyme A ligase [Moorella thermoacetica]APC07610.1 phenylacetate-coenzyme A ligase [Moorella thermoacetica]OIQ08649.1 phenylacetate-coenzyme A ligase [Moorella thermoacetica]